MTRGLERRNLKEFHYIAQNKRSRQKALWIDMMNVALILELIIFCIAQAFLGGGIIDSYSNFRPS